LAQPLVRSLAAPRWNLPESEEQKRIFYKLIIPVFPEERGKLEENTRKLLQMDKESHDWYIARSLSAILHSNPDLETPLPRPSCPRNSRRRWKSCTGCRRCDGCLEVGAPDAGSREAGSAPGWARATPHRRAVRQGSHR
jgi:hypothetical protein